MRIKDYIHQISIENLAAYIRQLKDFPSDKAVTIGLCTKELQLLKEEGIEIKDRELYQGFLFQQVVSRMTVNGLVYVFKVRMKQGINGPRLEEIFYYPESRILTH